MKTELAALAGKQQHIEAAPLFVVFLTDLSRASELGERRGLEMSDLDIVESFLLAAVDPTLAAQNALDYLLVGRNVLVPSAQPR